MLPISCGRYTHVCKSIRTRLPVVLVSCETAEEILHIYTYSVHLYVPHFVHNDSTMFYALLFGVASLYTML